MKKQFKTILTIVAVSAFSINLFAQKNEAAERLKNNLQKERLSDKDVNSAYDQLNLLIEQKATALSVKELLELTLLYSKHDPSDAPYGFMSAVKSIDAKEFDKAMKSYSKEDQKKIKMFIEINESSGGNG